MLTTRKRFRERDPIKVGLVGVAITLVMLVLAMSSGTIQRALTSETYTAYFREASGLTDSAEVRIGGLTVGEVESVELDRNRVRVAFTVEGPGNLGELTGAAIKTATPLGVKFLAVLPSGGGQLQAGAEIPLARTSSAYDLAGILGRLTNQAEELDTAKLAEALDTVATTMRDTPEELRGALDGLNRLSTMVAEQDEALRALLGRANEVTGLFARRNQQLSQLFNHGNQLLGELNRRREIIAGLLRTTNATVDEVRGLVQDNRAQLGPAMKELQGVLELLNRDEKLLGSIIQGFNIYAGSLGESVGGGPWFYGYIPNLAPVNIAPQLHNVMKALGP